MIFSPQRNFCFIHVPKTGGTSIEHAYSQAVTFGDIILDGSSSTMSRFYLETLNLGRHASAAQIVDMIGLVAFQSMFSVAVIRDPVERMISYFRWIQSFEHEGHIEKGLKKILDFDEFVDVALETLAPQADFICDPVSGDQLVQFLVPYTMLEIGWCKVCEFLKIVGGLPHLNKSTASLTPISAESRGQIQARYRKDFDIYCNIRDVFQLLSSRGHCVEEDARLGVREVEDCCVSGCLPSSSNLVIKESHDV